MGAAALNRSIDLDRIRSLLGADGDSDCCVAACKDRDQHFARHTFYLPLVISPRLRTQVAVWRAESVFVIVGMQLKSVSAILCDAPRSFAV